MTVDSWERPFRAFVLAVPVIVLVAMLSGAAAAQDAEVFYKSHKLTLAAPSNAGGGYDTYMRALSRHIGKYVPGEPTVIVQNVPAGGGMALANQAYNTAPKDGSYIGMVRGTVVQEEVYKNPQVHFESRKFIWIGNMNSDYDACVMWAASGVKTVDDFYKREVVVGASGAGAQSYSFPVVYRELLGMKFKVISGYPGTPERLLAMERGELTGACGITTTTFRSVLGQAAKEGKVLIAAQAGSHKDPRYPNVPNILDQAKTPEIHQALEFLFAPLNLGRPLAVPPETSKDRAAILEKASTQAMKDSAFLEEAEKLNIDIEPMDGAATANAVDRLFSTPPAVVARIQAALAAH
jgi:tripartite-type tricarboxylate transporter receptor subunit TctC